VLATLLFTSLIIRQSHSAEAVIKHEEGWIPSTNDRKFFLLDVSEEGARTAARVGVEVGNLAGTCFGRNQLARSVWVWFVEKIMIVRFCLLDWSRFEMYKRAIRAVFGKTKSISAAVKSIYGTCYKR